jgi:hypothetical protein
MKREQMFTLRAFIAAAIFIYSSAVHCLPVVDATFASQDASFNAGHTARVERRGKTDNKAVRNVYFVQDLFMHESVAFDDGPAYRARSHLYFDATEVNGRPQDPAMRVELSSIDDGPTTFAVRATDLRNLPAGDLLQYDKLPNSRRIVRKVGLPTEVTNEELLDPSSGRGILFDTWKQDPFFRLGDFRGTQTNDGHVFAWNVLRHPRLFGNNWGHVPGHEAVDFLVRTAARYNAAIGTTRNANWVVVHKFVHFTPHQPGRTHPDVMANMPNWTAKGLEFDYEMIMPNDKAGQWDIRMVWREPPPTTSAASDPKTELDPNNFDIPMFWEEDDLDRMLAEMIPADLLAP